MGLTKSQRAIIQKARSSSGEQALALSDAACCYLVSVIARDLGFLGEFPEFRNEPPNFFGASDLASLAIEDLQLMPLLERLIGLNPDADAFFACLANLHKRRLKFARILRTHPFATIEQIGPRGLLQYGTMSDRALVGLMFWRKWLSDLDNRAGQETGYLFEPIIAHAIGGVPFSDKKSPIRRSNDREKGRQVDCICDERAYEFKIRVTIASSGQGRWKEELEFPIDCRNSGYTPVLIVLDATPNPKLRQLEEAFLAQHGEVFAGARAWEHLDRVAGRTMALFLERYVRDPMQALLREVMDDLPDFVVKMGESGIVFALDGESISIGRRGKGSLDETDRLPDDTSDGIPGP